MKLNKNLNKLLICSVALASLLGIGAIGTNTQNIHASRIPAWIYTAAKKDKSDIDKNSITAKQDKQLQRIADKNATSITHKQIEQSRKAAKEGIYLRTHKYVAKKSVRHHMIKKHIHKYHHKRVNKHHLSTVSWYVHNYSRIRKQYRKNKMYKLGIKSSGVSDSDLETPCILKKGIHNKAYKYGWIYGCSNYLSTESGLGCSLRDTCKYGLKHYPQGVKALHRDHANKLYLNGNRWSHSEDA